MTVALPEFAFNDSAWVKIIPILILIGVGGGWVMRTPGCLTSPSLSPQHCVDVVHVAGRRPFGQNVVSIYADGHLRKTAQLRFPSLHEVGGHPTPHPSASSPASWTPPHGTGLGDEHGFFSLPVLHLLLHRLRGPPDHHHHRHHSRPPTSVPWTGAGLPPAPHARPIPVCPRCPRPPRLDPDSAPHGRGGGHHSGRQPGHRVGQPHLPGGSPRLRGHLLRGSAANSGQGALLRRWDAGGHPQGCWWHVGSSPPCSGPMPNPLPPGPNVTSPFTLEGDLVELSSKLLLYYTPQVRRATTPGGWGQRW